MSTEHPEISIIIPAYNAEQYLPGCLDSVFNQTFDNWELIIADDGSTDNTGLIADKYAASDERIRVIHIDNCGVSLSRNACLKQANGRYLFFLDADDYLAPDCLRVMIDQAQCLNADIVQCSYCLVDKNGNKISVVSSKNAVYDGADEIMNAYFTGPLGEIKISVWAKLFKRMSFANIYFDPRMKIYEDSLYVYECCQRSVKICVIDTAMYFYRQHAESVMHSCLDEIYNDYFLVFKRQSVDYKYNNMLRQKIAKRETETALWLMNSVIQETNRFKLWDLRRKALKSSEKILFSSTPMMLKLKVLGLAIMPHVYFWLLKKHNSDSKNALKHDIS